MLPNDDSSASFTAHTDASGCTYSPTTQNPTARTGKRSTGTLSDGCPHTSLTYLSLRAFSRKQNGMGMDRYWLYLYK